MIKKTSWAIKAFHSSLPPRSFNLSSTYKLIRYQGNLKNSMLFSVCHTNRSKFGFGFHQQCYHNDNIFLATSII